MSFHKLFTTDEDSLYKEGGIELTTHFLTKSNDNTNTGFNYYNNSKNNNNNNKIQAQHEWEKEEKVWGPFKDPIAFTQLGPSEVFEGLKTIKENKFCMDCLEPSSGWVSMYLGIFLCMNCAGVHRSLGSHVSFVRSIHLDKWNEEQLLYLILGGNKRLQELFVQHGLGNKPVNERYIDEAVRRHRECLHVDVMEQSYRLEKLHTAHVSLHSPTPAKYTTPNTSSKVTSDSGGKMGRGGYYQLMRKEERICNCCNIL